jgi:hypothetical protein
MMAAEITLLGEPTSGNLRCFRKREKTLPSDKTGRGEVSEVHLAY